MNLLRNTLIALAVAVPGLMQALNVDIATPGTLSESVTDHSVTTLAVSGTVNAADLLWVGANLHNLAELDLSGVAIEAYKGDVIGGHSEYAAGTIPAMAFAGLPLTKVVFPAKGDVSIGEGAFAGTSLTAVTFGDNIRTVGMGAFGNCPALTAVTIPADVVFGSYAFAGCGALVKVDLRNVTAVTDGLFFDCKVLSDVVGSESLVIIGARAFAQCPSLKAFTFSSRLRTVGAEAFEGSGLESVDLSGCGDLAEVGNWAFAREKDLASATFNAESHVAVGKGAFFDCTALRDLTLPAVAGLSDYVLKGAENADVTIPQGTETIGSYAMMNNRAVAALKLPSSLTSIGTGAMEGMTGLKAIDVTEVPVPAALGEKVWEGVTQKDVTLRVMDSNESDYRDAAQWQDFNFEVITGVNDITADAAKPSLQARFVGSDLVLRAANADIAGVRLYDVAGVMLVSIDCDSEEVVVDTSGFVSGLFIVTARLSDGSTGTLKLKRP